MDTYIKYVFTILKLKKLKLEVFSDNQKALNLYEKFNFKETSKKIVNHKNVICMELSNY
jgi:UDP-4-amino-4,6-dideoxy-N-acetyl-beta-L-altrosamine N-acetyltransferase